MTDLKSFLYMMATRPYLCIVVLILFFIAPSSPNARNKRAVSAEQARILTDNGHLIFQTGTNHNITFKSTNGGFVNVDGENFKNIVDTVKNNKKDVDRLKEQQNSNDVTSRLNNLESRLDSLTPTGEVANKLNLLTSQISDLTTRVSTLESNVNNEDSDQLRRLRRKVNRLEEELNTVKRQLEIDECASSPCRNGGTCVDMFNSFMCRCPNNWEGVTCETDVNECISYAGTGLGCQNQATCINTNGGYQCQCTANYRGIRCTETHDDCTGASNEALCGHGTCVNQARNNPNAPKYTCICNNGWTTNGRDPACNVDVNECEAPRSPCSVHPQVPCLNYPGSFHCGACPPGYSGNGHVCTDVNECETNNGGCSQSPRVSCTNTPGSRVCGHCPPGYRGNGVTCSYVGICHINNGGCHMQATCQEVPNIEGRICQCAPGYMGTGVGMAGCIPTQGSCTPNPCVQGNCSVSGNSYVCNCNPGWSGSTCNEDINECLSQPCANNGTCVNQLNGYSCTCTDEFTGPTCEDAVTSCGGRLTGDSGSLHYPEERGDGYPHGVSCAWVITVSNDKIIRVNFSEFHLEYHAQCNYDWLQLHDGPTAASHLIGKFCGTYAPGNGSVTTTHNKLYMWFHTDASQGGDGFILNWEALTPECGGELDEANYGVIKSPGYPGNYPNDRDCVWTVRVAPGNNIQLSLGEIKMEHHADCEYDYLKIYDGLEDTDPLLANVCSTMSPPPVTTSMPYARLYFHSDGSNSDKGFDIRYSAIPSVAGCGGRLTEDSGVVISPNFPNSYPHNVECVWVISLHASQTVAMTFTHFDVEHHPECTMDYIEVRDGNDETAPLIGRYCGRGSVPARALSTGESLWIKFKTDASNRGTGFRAEYVAPCGGIFTSPTGELQSPMYPNNYPHEKECYYLVTAPEGSTITVTFDAFSIEGDDDSSCNYDNLQIYDASGSEGPLLGRFCGRSTPGPFTSTNNMLFMKFTSDGSVANTGFHATYAFSEGGPGPADNCGGTLRGTEGNFRSPGHPGEYPHGVSCVWYIQSPESSVIRLTFNSFNMESHEDCQYDHVIVRDGPDTESGSLGKFCGSNTPAVLTSTGNALTVVMNSDASVAREGFFATWESINTTNTCGRSFSSEQGEIKSPSYPAVYPNSQSCEWKINLASGRQILLNITDFQLENSTGCSRDSLVIRDGGFENSPLIGKYCGTVIPNVIRSQSNRLFFKLTTDESNGARGFRITYDGTTSGCGGELTASTGTIVSPNYPLPYGHSAECFWTISVARGSRINFAFSTFHVEEHENCNYDYVELREEGSMGEVLGHYCGNDVPDPVTSKGSTLWVKFRTDYSNNAPGFRASYETICNVVITAHLGVIESLNFPSDYPPGINCNWTIVTLPGNTINASFSHFAIQGQDNCNRDYLELRDPAGSSSPTIGRYCGESLPMPIATTGNTLSVLFQSDDSVNYGGFRMEYMVYGCGGHFITPTGQFASPNYPNHYDSNRECLWTIDTRAGSSIVLSIYDFDVEEHQNCDFDKLEIRGGPDSTAPLLTTLCHTQTQPFTVTSTGNHMYIRFKTDASETGRGFRANYTTVDGGCGGNYTIPRGAITSKNYPAAYPANTDCTWNIYVEPGRSVELTWVAFNVEGHETCNYDNVAVYDGTNSQAPLLQKACGNTMPSPLKLQSTDNKMFIRMVSDGSVSATGFLANFTTGCGGHLSAAQDGEIVSPGWPDNFEANSDCTWVIQGPSNGKLRGPVCDRITLIFTHMDLAVEQNCTYHNVSVYDGFSVSSPLIGQYCGTATPASITSDGSALTVRFQASSGTQGTGFRATYSKSTSSCGGDFTSEQGAFNTPSFPYNYQNNIECVWTISTSPGNRIQVAFRQFDLEESDFCNHDFVEIRKDGPGGEFVGRYCGNNLPSNLTTANKFWIKFRTNGDVRRTGFQAQYNSVYGGDITGSSGQISSPLYPSNYPNDVNYNWIIRVDQGKYITATLKTIAIESSELCEYDNVKFLDGPDIDSFSLGEFCGTELPEPIHSSGNTLRVEFHSDASSNGRGFLLDWHATQQAPVSPTTPGPSVTPSPGCGGDLIASDGMQMFVSPGYPVDYANRLQCDWLIQSEAGSMVWVNITDIELESHSSCNFDYVAFYRNGIASGPPARKICRRSSTGYSITSIGNKILVRFSTDSSVNKTGFAAQYKKVCGGLIEGQTQGAIMSPGYPSSYQGGANCTWMIKVANGRTIAAIFEGFNLPGTNGQCGDDQVMLLNGASLDSPPLGSSPFCGNSVPSTLETMSNYLTVVFTSSSSPIQGRTGFKLTFEERSVTCGGHLTLNYANSDGYIMSPNYPDNYPSNVDCIWIITGPSSTEIQLDFDDSFEIETHPNCNYDYVEVRDGSTENSQQLARYCGRTGPGTVKSTDSVIYVRFRTDNSVPKKGFKAKYSIASCGGTIRADQGRILSPNFPSTYPSESDCEWYIYASDGHFITISFEAFSIQQSPECAADWLEIRDYNSTGQLLSSFCGTDRPAATMTTDSIAYVKFKSNNQQNAGGFDLRFQASVEECGGDWTTPTGTFTSPNYPNQYPHNRRCEWKITVDIDRRVTLTFDDFQMEEVNNCHYDNVKVYNGIMDDSPRIGTYCGASPPNPVQSTGNTMRVEFYTDGSQTFRGFSATYSSENEAVCGGTIHSSSSPTGVISSPNYDDDSNSTYSNNQQCIWQIENQVHSNSSIILKFVDEFDVESHGDCIFDFVELREGFNEQGHFYARFCGNSTPPIIVSPGPALWLAFISDVSVVNKGFTATYSFSACGGIISTESGGVITSPNYPNNYEHNENCAWKLQAPEGHQIKVRFTNLDMEHHGTCNFDFIRIHNGGLASSPEMAKLCGTATETTLPEYLSQSNEMRIVFHSDSSSSERGFRLVYSVDSQACGGNLHSNEGSISSPSHPAVYPNNAECIWEINVQNGYHVELAFDGHFDMEIQNPPCTNDYVEVTDVSHNGSETVLGRYCGNHAPPALKSTTNIMRVKFRSNNRINGNGFNATFNAVCGAQYTMERGTLVSPGYPGNYANDLNCNYTISVDPQKFVILTFQPSHFGIEGFRNKPGPSSKDSQLQYPNQWKKYLTSRNISALQLEAASPFAVTEDVWNYYYPQYAFPGINGYLCSYDYVKINDGRRFCGYTAPQPVGALGQMELTFVSDYMITDKGWIATYVTSECGGQFTEATGIIQTPVINDYHDNANCTWYIEIQEDRVVELKFLDFSIEAHSECRYDYVSIYDGQNLTAPLIGTYCGSQIPQPIKTTGRYMLVNFISDNSVSSGGFRAAYRTTFGQLQGCGGVLNATSGRFSSVNYHQSDQYEPNLECIWQLIVPENKVITLHYESFAVESGDDCDYDYLEVRDGMFATDALVGKYCGNTRPLDFTSASNVLFVKFFSDDSVQKGGFEITYTTQDSTCGGLYSAEETKKTISSPNYPNALPANSRCRWTLDAPEGNTLQVDFESINIPDITDCPNNYVEVKDYPLGEEGRVFHYCGTSAPHVFQSAGRTVQVNLITGGTSVGTGFRINYKIASCNRTYEGTNGRVVSPGWPGNYPHNISCETLVRAPEGNSLSIYFNAFRIEPHSDCNYDYLKVFNGSDASSPLLYTLCGVALPDPISLPGNTIFMQFQTDNSVSHPGYDITYTSSPNGCGGNLTATHGALASPGYPDEPSPRGECNWLISVPARRQITFILGVLDIQARANSTNCDTNYLALYDGPTSSSPLVGQYCGPVEPATFTSSSNKLFVRFRSDSQFQGSGFLAKYTS